MRVLALCFALVACSTGGQYVQGERDGDDDKRGETNGRMFDFVSNLPDGEDWQIRIRDSSLWAAYSEGEKSQDLGTANLSGKQTDKVWKLVDALEIADRKKGQKDEDEGWVQMRLREPGGEEGHDMYTVFISRVDAEDDEDLLALAEYLQDLVEKHFKKKPEF